MYKSNTWLKQLSFTNLRYGCASDLSFESGTGRWGFKSLQTLGISHWSITICTTTQLKYFVLRFPEANLISAASWMLHFHVSLFSPPPSPLWNQEVSDLPATIRLCTGQVKLRESSLWMLGCKCQLQVLAISPSGSTVWGHKTATATWAKGASSLMTQDSFSKFGFVFQALEILRCHQGLTATYRAPLCVTSGTQEPFLRLWAETAADWHLWLGSLESPLLFLLVLIM